MIKEIIGLGASVTIVVIAIMRQREAKKNGNDIERVAKIVDRAEELCRKKGVCPTCHK